MKTGNVLAFLLFTLTAWAQNIETGRDAEKSVTVTKDPRFDQLAAKQAEINHRAQKLLPKWVNGWRIQAANTQNREEANNVKAEMLKRYPEHKTYLLYQSPNFRVRVGDFLTQRDAFKMRKEIAALYPGKGIYIVPDMIEVEPTPEENEKD